MKSNSTNTYRVSKYYYRSITGYEFDSVGATEPSQRKKYPSLNIINSGENMGRIWDMPIHWDVNKRPKTFLREYTHENAPSFLWNVVLKEFYLEDSHSPTWYSHLKDTNIESFRIHNIKCTMDDVETIAQNLPKNLEILEFSDADIDNEKLNCLLGYIKGSKIKTLILDRNNISGRGLLALVEFCVDTKIEEIILDANKIRNRGLTQVAQLLKDTAL